MPDDQQQPQQPQQQLHDGTGKFRLRKIPTDPSGSGNSTRNDSQRGPAAALSADASVIEDIIRRTVDTVSASVPRPPNSSSNTSELQGELVELKERLTATRAQLDASQAETEGVRAQLATLEAKHIQFVEANIAFTQYRDQVERERASWAEANAKFARRHEENKTARATLLAKYKATVEDLDTMTAKYESAKREIARLNGTLPPPPYAPSARNPGPPISPPGSSALDRPREREPAAGLRRSDITRERDQRPPKDRSIRGVERDQPPHRPASLTHAQQAEQSMLRERLTSDMFTLSQKILEERAQRAEEGRAMAERRIFELEGQISRDTNGVAVHDRLGGSDGGGGGAHWREGGSVSRGPQPPLQPYPPLHSAGRDFNGSPSSSWSRSPHVQPHPQPPLLPPTPSLSHSPTQSHHRYADRDVPRPSHSVGEWDRETESRGRPPPPRPLDTSSTSNESDRDYRRHEPPSSASSSSYASYRQSSQHHTPTQLPPPPRHYQSSSTSSSATSPQQRTYPQDWDQYNGNSRRPPKRGSNGEPINSEQRLPPLPPSRDYESQRDFRGPPPSIPPPPPSRSPTSMTRPSSPPSRPRYTPPKPNGSSRPDTGSRTAYLNADAEDEDYAMED